MLTKLEEQVLMTVWKFKGDGYGVNIFQYLEDINKKKITLGVVYDILERLRKNGYLEACLGSPTPVRGGMRKKYYRITKKGIRKLIESKKVYDRVMDGFEELARVYKAKNA